MICPQCGQAHSADELELAFRRPDVIAAMDPQQREQTVQESDDICAIQSLRYFVRAVLPLPVATRERRYAIGLWVEVDEPACRRIVELWSDPGQSAEPPFDGRIANSIPTLPSTLDLAVQLRLTGPTTRPEAYLQAQDHPLFAEQSQGISPHRAHEYSVLSASRGWLPFNLPSIPRFLRGRRRTS